MTVAINRAEMTPLQRTLYDAYVEQWHYHHRAAKEVNYALGQLDKARAIRDGSQRRLDEMHALLVDHGVAAKVEAHFPVAPCAEETVNGRPAMLEAF